MKKATVIDSIHRIEIDYDEYDKGLGGSITFFIKNKEIARIPKDKTVIFATPEPDDVIIYPYKERTDNVPFQKTVIPHVPKEERANF